MSLPEIRPGLLIHYGFLWSEERRRGQEQASKDRPCAVVVATAQADGGTRTIVVPVTRTPPDEPDAALEVPDSMKRQLGLKPDRQWVRLDELNRFIWPGYDLTKIPGTDHYDYGMIPGPFFRQIKAGIMSLDAKLRKTSDRE
ncbi:hypothetical protein [Nisaea sp.]|uniref:hypothetical protein n=1 Tax=Nisaea sp. TaxID=2024842 RepID=UPI0032640B32